MAVLNKDEMLKLLESFLADGLNGLFNEHVPPQKRQLVLVLVEDDRFAILKVDGYHDPTCVVKEHGEPPQAWYLLFEAWYYQDGTTLG